MELMPMLIAIIGLLTGVFGTLAFTKKEPKRKRVDTIETEPPQLKLERTTTVEEKTKAETNEIETRTNLDDISDLIDDIDRSNRASRD